VSGVTMNWSMAILAYVALVGLVTVLAVRVLLRADQYQFDLDELRPKFFRPDGAFLHQVALSYCGHRPEVYYVVAGDADSAIAIARILSVSDHYADSESSTEIRTVGCQRLPSISAIDLTLDNDREPA
jgi:hypothetical protein